MSATGNREQLPLDLLRQRIRAAEVRFSRVPNSVGLLAVSKTRTATEVRHVAAQDQRRFGENYLQDALPKLDSLKELGLEWHFIGRIQSNKTRQIAALFDWVHSVDRPRIAERLAQQRPKELAPLNVCIQVNISAEITKSGCNPEDLPPLVDTIVRLPRLRLRGLMALPAPATEFEQQRLPFRRIHGLYQELNAAGVDIDTLSIGTSSDYEAAIAEGATLIRLGSAIFGPRSA